MRRTSYAPGRFVLQKSQDDSSSFISSSSSNVSISSTFSIFSNNSSKWFDIKPSKKHISFDSSILQDYTVNSLESVMSIPEIGGQFVSFCHVPFNFFHSFFLSFFLSFFFFLKHNNNIFFFVYLGKSILQ